jgi:exodeoxyribonuclease V beta subunit
MSPPRYRKPAIVGQIPHGRHAVIEASAGTGKTYTLEHLVVDLVLSRGVRLENILVVTFTEKATAELTARVRAKIEELLGTPEPAPDGTPDDECWVLDEAARATLREALFAFDRANISTIHAFCQRVLTEHAFSHRRLFEERQVDERAAFATAFKHVLRHGLARDPALTGYLSAWLAWRSPEVAELEGFLYECHRRQSQLTPTFDPAALARVLDRLAADPPADGELAELLADWRARRDLPGLLGALDARDGDKCSAALPPELERVRVPLIAAVAQVCLPLIAERLRGQKREAGRFDFQDMLTLVAESLDGPDGEAAVRQLRERYHVALIDEFQDTDSVQWRIFERIFFEAPGGTRPLIVIGDPKQAIYGFRGADVHTYLRAREAIRAGGGVVVPLSDNFRSTTRVIRAYNAILDQRAEPPFFTGAIRYDDPVRCGRPEHTALDGRGQEVPALKLFELTTRARKPRIAEVKRALAERIAMEIGNLLGSGITLVDGKRRQPLRPSDIFVLTRSGAEGYEVGAALRAVGLPHAYYKQDGLYQTAEAEHVRDLLAAVDDPHRVSRRLRAWLTPFFGVELAELRACQELPGTHPLLQRLLDWKTVADAEDYEQLFTRILEESGLLRRLLFRDQGERELTNYLHLFELLLEQAGRVRASLTELVTQLSSLIAKQAMPEGVDGNVQRLESERDAVQIMTMHKAKGLEAAVVFLYGGFWTIGANDPLRSYHAGGQRLAHVGRVRDPEAQARIAQEAREEDQRLLYVALTRARAQLVLPLFPDGSFSLPEGACYRPLNAQLLRLQQRGDASLREVMRVEPFLLDAQAAPPPAEPARTPGTWVPPAELLRDPADDDRFRRASQSQAGFAITSYTRMKQGQARPSVLAREDFAAERNAASPVVLADGDLPAGAATGVFLHQLLEEVPLASFGARSFDTWRAREDVRERLDATLRRHDIDPRYREHAERILHTAYTMPVKLGDVHMSRGLHAATRLRREMEFLYPVERDFVKGYVDLVFEHEGRVYFADWKSDLLPGWDPGALAAHVAEHYRLQAQLYSLALVKLLDVRTGAEYEARFGGMLFCFLRGMRGGLEPAPGLHFDKPTWSDIGTWQDRLERGEPLTAFERGGAS